MTDIAALYVNIDVFGTDVITEFGLEVDLLEESVVEEYTNGNYMMKQFFVTNEQGSQITVQSSQFIVSDEYSFVSEAFAVLCSLDEAHYFHHNSSTISSPHEYEAVKSCYNFWRETVTDESKFFELIETAAELRRSMNDLEERAISGEK